MSDEIELYEGPAEEQEPEKEPENGNENNPTEDNQTPNETDKPSTENPDTGTTEETPDNSENNQQTGSAENNTSTENKTEEKKDEKKSKIEYEYAYELNPILYKGKAIDVSKFKTLRELKDFYGDDITPLDVLLSIGYTGGEVVSGSDMETKIIAIDKIFESDVLYQFNEQITSKWEEFKNNPENKEKLDFLSNELVNNKDAPELIHYFANEEGYVQGVKVVRVVVQKKTDEEKKETQKEFTVTELEDDKETNKIGLDELIDVTSGLLDSKLLQEHQLYDLLKQVGTLSTASEEEMNQMYNSLTYVDKLLKASENVTYNEQWENVDETILNSSGLQQYAYVKIYYPTLAGSDSANVENPYIMFKAFPENTSNAVNASYSDSSVIGRPGTVGMYTNTSDNVSNFSLSLHREDYASVVEAGQIGNLTNYGAGERTVYSGENKTIDYLISYIESAAYPLFTSTGTHMPLIKFIFGDTEINGKLTSFNAKWSGPRINGKQMHCEVSLSITNLFNSVPNQRYIAKSNPRGFGKWDGIAAENRANILDKTYKNISEIIDNNAILSDEIGAVSQDPTTVQEPTTQETQNENIANEPKDAYEDMIPVDRVATITE